jgi:hypothetical protein
MLDKSSLLAKLFPFCSLFFFFGVGWGLGGYSSFLLHEQIKVCFKAIWVLSIIGCSIWRNGLKMRE